ncbi:MAG: adenylate/guanylate cyclase domain-containing protein [Alphaproteobacteria bacterium]|jgi:TolB-like protein/class 3 adenylate cyclase|nr:adenylate/guanylate cyclase domain-containing protein [Alphaproteobacteria bacterium]MDP6568132.1 adenylate/guanylate cyclase domain-containing protein [Alphaproteobacteria bacterium]MDP6813325.1 adenylate/guanylate cyclase domain-containing protein [Alphaproteobacteria bacterium]
MAEGSVERRLVAIVAIDVAGYSRLMGADEDGTLAALKGHREATTPIGESHGGRMVGTAGDGELWEFPSVTEAVRCAVRVQALMTERNADLPAQEKMLYRIGINLGDVMIDGDDIYGDGVNIAARLEALADPGGVCISQTVLDHVRDRVDVPFDDAGEVDVKNIARPIRVWRWSPAGLEVVAVPATAEPPEAADKPSIAVLPFDNMSDDPEQEYFSDGIAEDIITDLSKFSWLTVVARNSSFAFKGQAVDLRTVAKELGVRYVLEGSVRRAGSRVRINAQLIDADDGGHIWAERYDRELDDIFDLQDEMTQAINAAVGPELESFEIRRALGKRPENLDAWDYVLQARAVFGLLTRKTMVEVRRLAGLALEIQSDYSEALACVAMSHALDAMSGWTDSPAESAERAIEAARLALQGNPNGTWALSSRGYGEAVLGLHDQAVNTLRQVIRVNPNESLGHQGLATVLVFRGDYPEAVREAELAFRLSPRGIDASYVCYVLALAHFADGNAAEALKWCDKLRQEFPDFSIDHLYAAACVEVGEIDKGKKAIAHLLEVAPRVTIRLLLDIIPAKEGDFPKRYERALRVAGLPEE